MSSMTPHSHPINATLITAHYIIVAKMLLLGSELHTMKTIMYNIEVRNGIQRLNLCWRERGKKKCDVPYMRHNGGTEEKKIIWSTKLPRITTRLNKAGMTKLNWKHDVISRIKKGDNNIHAIILHSDWLRACQFFLSQTVQKCEIESKDLESKMI